MITVMSKLVIELDCLVSGFNRCFKPVKMKLRMMWPEPRWHNAGNCVLGEGDLRTPEGWWKPNHCELPAHGSVAKSKMRAEVKQMRYSISSGTTIMRLSLACKSSSKSQAFKGWRPSGKSPENHHRNN